MTHLPIGFGPSIHAAADTVPGAGDHWHPLGSLPFYRFISMLDGNLSVRTGGQRYRLQPGMVFLQQPGQEYQFGSIARKHWCFVTFDVVWQSVTRAAGMRSDVMQPSPSDIWGHAWPSMLPADVHAMALRTMRRIASLHWRGPVAAHEASAQLSLLLARLASRFADPVTSEQQILQPDGSSNKIDTDKQGGDGQLPGQSQRQVHGGLDARLQAAENFVRNRMPRSVTVADMAASVGMSREHFSRCYSQDRAQKPSQFIQRQRLDEAQVFLQNPNMSLVDIAKAMGFSAVSNFTHWFSRAAGQTPTAWRRQL